MLQQQTKATNSGNETSTLCNIKILCFERKKVCNSEVHSSSKSMIPIPIELRVKSKATTPDITGLYSRSKGLAYQSLTTILSMLMC